MKRKLLALLLTLVMTASMFAVSAAAAEPAETLETESFTVTDMKGREVEIPAEITSIATFGACGVLNTFLETMGSGDLIVNDMAPNFTKSKKWAMQYEFAPQISGAPVLQNSDGEILIEDTIALDPDLCFTMGGAMVDTLEGAGMNVVYFNWDTGDELKAAITLLGQILQKEELAAQYCDYFDETVAKAEALVADLDESEKKTVVYGDVTSFSNPHMISEWWITEGGGISVTEEMHTEQSLTYTLEDLLLWNPDVMFVTSNQAEELQADSQLAEITAVKDGAIYTIPCVGHVWGNRSTEQPLVILWTIYHLYPDLYSYDDFAEDISYFYHTFFNYDLSDEQIEKIIG